MKETSLTGTHSKHRLSRYKNDRVHSEKGNRGPVIPRGQDKVGKTDVVMPKNLKRESRYLKKKREERCRSRAGVEGLISHLKHDFRMLINYLKGTNGDKINTLLAAAVYNMKKWMAIKKKEIIFAFFENIRKLFSAVQEDLTFNWNLGKVNY